MYVKREPKTIPMKVPYFYTHIFVKPESTTKELMA